MAKEALMAVDLTSFNLICAPTSSGKTVITTYLSLQEGTKIFVVPSESLVWQALGILAHFYRARSHYLVKTLNTFPDSPPELYCYNAEGNIYCCNGYLKDPFHAVFDEIHDLNGPEGDAIERLLKTITCPVLGLLPQLVILLN